MFDPDKVVRKNVRGLVPYSCARDEFQGIADVYLDANESPFGTLNRYPDPYQKELKEAVSKLKGIPVANIFLGNGSDEIIDLAFRIFCEPSKGKALTFAPTYGMYEVSAGINDVKLIKIPLNEKFEIETEKVLKYTGEENLNLIFICTPNNPTGNAVPVSTICTIAEKFNGVVLVDEAYSDFSAKQSMKEFLGKYPNLIVMQTFSKAHGLASVRVGMAFASEEILKFFNKMKPPYNISTINQKTVLKALKNSVKYEKQVALVLSERIQMENALRNISVVKRIYPSDANFLLIEVTDANRIYEYLTSAGIIVRNRNSVVRNCLRITIGTKSENRKLVSALKKYS